MKLSIALWISDRTCRQTWPVFAKQTLSGKHSWPQMLSQLESLCQPDRRTFKICSSTTSLPGHTADLAEGRLRLNWTGLSDGGGAGKTGWRRRNGRFWQAEAQVAAARARSNLKTRGLDSSIQT